MLTCQYTQHARAPLLIFPRVYGKYKTDLSEGQTESAHRNLCKHWEQEYAYLVN